MTTPTLFPARQVPLGGIRGSTVYRTLPQRELPTVGAWCFLDQGVPGEPAAKVLPHPHIGLQTVTWMFDGTIRHRDSLGTDATVRAGALNLMTAGHGIAHSEYPMVPGMEFAAVQLWIALPEHARHGASAFEQLRELPAVALAGMRATVLIGDFAGVHSPATVHTPMVGVDLRLEPGAALKLPLRPDFEHALYPVSGSLLAADTTLGARTLAYFPTGPDVLTVRAGENGCHCLLLGGAPLGEDLVMWWNFVARTHEEVAQARADWESGDGRFGHIPGHGAERIPAPPLPGVRLTPRRRRPPHH